MATERTKRPHSEIEWLDASRALLTDATDVVVIGIPESEFLAKLQLNYPQINIIAIDYRHERLESSLPGLLTPLQYITSKSGVLQLKDRLTCAEKPIPVLSLTFCWTQPADFLSWAQEQLIGHSGIKTWMQTPAAFILESLFV